MKPEELLKIAESGVLAPSADNRHVARFELGNATIRLWPTAEFAGTTERHRRVLGWLSLGAVIENMRLRAGELGYNTAVRWSPPVASRWVAEVEFRAEGSSTAEDLGSAIEARHTNRRMYGGPGLSDTERARLNEAVGGVPDVRLVWLNGPARRQALALIWRAESERFLRKRLHDELFSSIRFDLPWDATAAQALAPAALEVERPMRPLFKALRHWSLMSALNRLGAYRMLGLRVGWLPCWQAPALGVLTTTRSAEDAAVDVGRAMQRLWLRATLLGLAFQPMAAATVLPLQADADDGASARTRDVLQAGWRAIPEIGSLVTPMMILRLGRAREPRFRSGRPGLQELMVRS